MADHELEQIMTKVVTALTGLTTTGANVTRDLSYELALTVDNAIGIFQGDDFPVDQYQSEIDPIDNYLNIELFLYSRIVSTTPISKQLNQIRKEIYIALVADRTLGLSFTWGLQEAGGQKPIVDTSSQNPTAKQQITWRIFYRHSANDPSINA